jgi:hypothetical protein
MPLVEQYPNYLKFQSVADTDSLVDAFYKNSSVWGERPATSFFANCSWYKFPYCSHVPWYQDLNTQEIVGPARAEIYQSAVPVFNHMLEYLGDDYIMWGAELNCVHPGLTVPTHQDKHFYSDYTTRLHAVLTTNTDVKFIFENSTHSFEAGDCFVFNNKMKHSIQNKGNTDRLHLVVDFVPKNVFKYVERSIAPFGGHEGTRHILCCLTADNPLYSEYIETVPAPYPKLTAKHI